MNGASPRHTAPVRLRRFTSLDGYRALAAVAVLITHVGFQTAQTVNGSLGGIVARLDIGVSLFFLLSGFLLFLPHTRAALTGAPRPAVVPYLWRRALRVLPAYWLAVIAAMLLVRGNEQHRESPSSWVTQLLLLQVYQPDSLVPGLTQMWSLAVEVSFYLVLPLLAAAVTRRHRGQPGASARFQLTALAGLAGLAWSWQVWVRTGHGPHPGLASLWLPAYLDWFAIGMALATIHGYLHVVPVAAWSPPARVLADIAQAPWACWLTAAGLYVVLTTPLGGPLGLETPTVEQAVFRHIAYGAVAALLLLPGFLETPTGPPRLLSSPFAAWLGTISYGIFLYHLIVLDLVFVAQDRPFFDGAFWRVLLPTLAVSVAVAALSWYLLESRVLRLKSRGPGRPRSEHAVAPTDRRQHSEPRHLPRRAAPSDQRTL
jgi:peptidoglycan/LPS O-acetylase OafA/YrhL